MLAGFVLAANVAGLLVACELPFFFQSSVQSRGPATTFSFEFAFQWQLF